MAVRCPIATRTANRMHDIDRQFGQLRQAGISAPAEVDLSWSLGDIARFDLPVAYRAAGARQFATSAGQALAGRALSRHWPAMLAERGLTPVVIGTAPEQPLALAIRDVVPCTIDLTGRTDFVQLTSLARRCAGGDRQRHRSDASARRRRMSHAWCCSRAIRTRRCARRAGRRCRVLRRPDLAELRRRPVQACAIGLMAPPPALLAADGGPAAPVNRHLAVPDGVPMPQRYWAILTIALGLTLAVLDGAIANVALPTIARELDASAGRLDLGGERLSARGDDLAAAAGVAGRDLSATGASISAGWWCSRSPRWAARCPIRC